jgi:hypothetical protein
VESKKHTEGIDAFPRDKRDDLVLESEARHQRPREIRQEEVTDCLPNIFAVSQGALSILTAIPPPTAVFLTRSTDLCSFSRLVLSDELISYGPSRQMDLHLSKLNDFPHFRGFIVLDHTDWCSYS